MVKAQNNKIRIIGGVWRSRLISVPVNVAGLRPTPNRVRETVFNWLSPKIFDARVLDAFCGSGALSLEALSRGAKSVVILDISHNAISNLCHNLHTLQAQNAEVMQIDALNYLASVASQKFDVVFLDPPFNVDVISTCCELLVLNNWLNCNALIYVESPKTLANLKLPPNWHIYREQQAAGVYYGLLRFYDF